MKTSTIFSLSLCLFALATACGEEAKREAAKAGEHAERAAEAAKTHLQRATADIAEEAKADAAAARESLREGGRKLTNAADFEEVKRRFQASVDASLDAADERVQALAERIEQKGDDAKTRAAAELAGAKASLATWRRGLNALERDAERARAKAEADYMRRHRR